MFIWNLWLTYEQNAHNNQQINYNKHKAVDKCVRPVFQSPRSMAGSPETQWVVCRRRKFSKSTLYMKSDYFLRLTTAGTAITPSLSLRLPRGDASIQNSVNSNVVFQKPAIVALVWFLVLISRFVLGNYGDMEFLVPANGKGGGELLRGGAFLCEYLLCGKFSCMFACRSASEKIHYVTK